MRTTTSAKATVAATTTSTASATATQVPASAEDPVINVNIQSTSIFGLLQSYNYDHIIY